MTDSVDALLSLGSNIGDRLANLRQAVHQLDQHEQIGITALSSVYETEPVGGVKQASFYNIAIKIQTTLAPEKLLDVCHQIERALHRKRLIHWGPRTIDLDIIYYDDQTIQTATLQVPHPEMGNRRFVLVPTLEILTSKDHHYQLTKALLDHTSDQNWIKKKYTSEVLRWTK